MQTISPANALTVPPWADPSSTAAKEGSTLLSEIETRQLEAIKERSGGPPAPRGSPRPPSSPGIPVSQQVAVVDGLRQRAAESSARGDYAAALEGYTAAARVFPELARAQYARTGRALMLYQLGDVTEALLELQSQQAELGGSAEVHAALAAVLYTERPRQLSLAEDQWERAIQFDPRYKNVEWVASTKMWPPRMLEALTKFVQLK